VLGNKEKNFGIGPVLGLKSMFLVSKRAVKGRTETTNHFHGNESKGVRR